VTLPTLDGSKGSFFADQETPWQLGLLMFFVTRPGKRLQKNYGKSQCIMILMGKSFKSTINDHFQSLFGGGLDPFFGLLDPPTLPTEIPKTPRNPNWNWGGYLFQKIHLFGYVSHIF
jgi:hypothetical protein